MDILDQIIGGVGTKALGWLKDLIFTSSSNYDAENEINCGGENCTTNITYIKNNYYSSDSKPPT